MDRGTALFLSLGSAAGRLGEPFVHWASVGLFPSCNLKAFQCVLCTRVSMYVWLHMQYMNLKRFHKFKYLNFFNVEVFLLNYAFSFDPRIIEKCDS